jgi:error-prone DNA polymerase
VLTCIREKTTIEAVGRKLEANAERFMNAPREMARLFRDFPEAVKRWKMKLKRNGQRAAWA